MDTHLDIMPALLTTRSGREIDLLNITEDDIDIEDIAHALSRICRFGGHIPCHYSVAQHSILVAAALPAAGALEGLMHDASEAYLGDMVTPLKKLPAMAGYRVLEDRVMSVIASKYQLGMGYWRSRIHAADKRAFVTESLNFRGSVDQYSLDHWGAFGEDGEIMKLRAVPAKEARDLFLECFYKVKADR